MNPEYAEARALLPEGTPLELHYLQLLLNSGTDAEAAIAAVKQSDHRAIRLQLALLARGAA